MSIEITGKVFKVLQEQRGQGSNGEWVKQEFVIETAGEYPKKVVFNCWGDKTQLIKSLNTGDLIKVSFEPSSREYNERWYTDLRAWKIEKVGAEGSASGAAPPPPAATDAPPASDDEDDGLPF